MVEALRSKLATLMGQPVADLGALHGGDLSKIYSATLADGTRLAIKTGAQVNAEGRMLQALSQAGCPAPAVLATDTDILVMAYLDEIPASADGWASLGHTLRTLHNQHGTHFGWEQDYAFGAAEIPNAPRHSWPAFWGEQRLLALAPDLPTDIVKRLETLAKALPDLLPAHPTPSLLHGDLWAGNILFTPHGAHLIDPACYFGDAEVDLAMLHLFDKPGAAFTAAYGPLEPGWQDRRPIYTLWPALVHLRLFGQGYRSLVENCLSAAGS